MKKYLYEEQDQRRPLVHVDGCSCGSCGKSKLIDPRLQMMPDNPDIADGMLDPNLAIAYDPLFGSVLGTSVSRRSMLKGLAALGGMAGLG
ncbi:MAG: twin-arginine translocation signal domain-containing protein, partial [Thiobacillus sp.]|nr:twin-arginine translocation signal domain-containing protein [Thiobacillus sp.]